MSRSASNYIYIKGRSHIFANGKQFAKFLIGHTAVGVFVRNKKTGRVQIVRFGAKGMSIKKNIPARQKSFFARFRPILAKVKGQKTLSPAYWAIQSWKKGFKI